MEEDDEYGERTRGNEAYQAKKVRRKWQNGEDRKENVKGKRESESL